MKLSHVIEAVYLSPWNITREGWQAVDAIVRPRIGSQFIMERDNYGRLQTGWQDVRAFQSEADRAKLQGAADDTDKDFLGNPLPKMEIRDGVAIIPVNGTLIHKATLLEKQCGACSYQDIKANVTEALDAGVDKIVLNVDCPGGMSMGASETGRFIGRASEYCRIEAVTDGLMCSAAYEVCAAAHKIYATPTSVTGSIGTYMAVLDESARHQMEGIKIDVIASDKFKGAGAFGTPLTPEQRENYQQQVYKYSGMFKEHVRANRIVEESVMQGQSFIGSDGVDAGLIDEIIEEIEECFEL